MHVRESKVRRGDKVYRYVQLVQSFRRPDGMPATRVIASFGDLSETQTAAVRTFAKALSSDQPLRLEGEPAEEDVREAIRVLANLDYLPLAVLLRLWQKSGLADLVQRSLGASGRDVPDADVVAALVLHRCVDADSTLAAERWFPTTALPEVFGWAPEKFNNSRLHRTLEALEACEDDLQGDLPGVLRSQYGPVSAVLIDATDTWFEGHGPEMASHGRVKDGTFRRKILIVVACDARGFPLRWKTFEGGKSEVHALQEMATTVGSCAWLQDAPIIVDRALGNHASIEILARTGRRFVVAVPEHEIASWVPGLPGLPLDTDLEDRAAIERAVEGLGMEKADARTWVIEGADLPVSPPTGGRWAGLDTLPANESVSSRNIELMALARRMAAEGGSLGTIARRFQRSKSHVRDLLALLQLPEDVRARIEAGEGADLALSSLSSIVFDQDGEEARRAAFERLLASTGRKGLSRKARSRAPDPEKQGPTSEARSPYGRPIVYFNPEMFADQRRRALAELAGVREALSGLNRGRGTPAVDGQDLLLRADRLLRRHDMVSLFDLVIDTSSSRPLLLAHLRESSWERRRRFDGFSLLVVDPHLAVPPEQAVTLYRARECVERDFRTIKSVVELRPVYHRTDAKVRAHVTLCVLATLLHRLLEHHLALAGAEMSAVRALALFACCHLNKVHDRGPPHHTLTALLPATRDLLKRLHFEDLADDRRVVTAIVPR